VDWQLTAIASRTWKGENDLGEPFLPGSPLPDVAKLEGVVQVTDDVAGVVRWWPASGVDVSVTLGLARVHDAAHVAGAEQREQRAAIAFRLVR
jgi:hypothetical protein